MFEGIILSLYAMILGYFFGSLFISYFWAKRNSIDITTVGTGQLGASNAGRCLGWQAMIVSGIFDILKAAMAVFIVITILQLTQKTEYKDLIITTTSFGVLIGHMQSFWIYLDKKKWHGGKGGSILGGTLLILSWESFLVLYGVIMVILQLGKLVVLGRKGAYRNFYINTIVVICSPVVVFWFTRSLWSVTTVLILIATIAISESEKISSIVGIGIRSDNN
jgi:glycerol-3-phosphate acyltransferase PlsY